MNSRVVEAPGNPAAGLGPSIAGAAEDLAGLEPVKTLRSRWPMIIAAVLSLAMIAGLAKQLLGTGLSGLSHAAPNNWLYYIAFALLYISPPFGDYVIFRRLWKIPLEGFAALIKKRIANEAVVGYSGDAYFYAWARTRATMVAAPFGAVKDVTILSAIAGNVMTLAMTALALPFAFEALPSRYYTGLAIGIPIVIAMCLPFLIFSRKVFTLDRKTLWWIFMIHCARLSAGCLLIAFAWHFGLPGISIGVWLVLSATRMLVSRLPFVNKDLVFTTVTTAILAGHGTSYNNLADLIAFTTALTLVVHVAFAGIFAIQSVIKRQI
jgi:hypothetical protein